MFLGSLHMKWVSTGSQIYEGRLDWALADRWQVGAFGQVFDDPPLCGLPACESNLTMLTGGGTVKYKLLETGRLSAAMALSLEALYLEGNLYNSEGDAAVNAIGSIQIPLSYTLDDTLRIHFVQVRK